MEDQLRENIKQAKCSPLQLVITADINIAIFAYVQFQYDGNIMEGLFFNLVAENTISIVLYKIMETNILYKTLSTNVV